MGGMRGGLHLVWSLGSDWIGLHDLILLASP